MCDHYHGCFIFVFIRNLHGFLVQIMISFYCDFKIEMVHVIYFNVNKVSNYIK